ncbi:hypothetical protein BD408DRAFT_414407 [Parasitella parasitica]|nr:hypothetical protein BD408DRAFT_414407 [Parasitella parasitica]
MLTKWDRSSKLKFRCYRKKLKAFSEIVKMFTHVSIKYRTGASTDVKSTMRNNNEKQQFLLPPSTT